MPRSQAEPQTHLIGLGVAPAPRASIHRLFTDPQAETVGTSELCLEGATTTAWGAWMGESPRSEAGREHASEDKGTAGTTQSEAARDGSVDGARRVGSDKSPCRQEP